MFWVQVNWTKRWTASVEKRILTDKTLHLWHAQFVKKNCARKNVNTLTRELISIYNRPQSRDQTAEKGKEIISSFEQLPLVHLPSPGVSGRSVVGRTAAAPFTSAKAEDEDWTHFFLVINFLTSPTALVLFI